MAASIKIARSDQGLLAQSLNFSTHISAAPTTYGLSAAQATAYGTLHANYATALAAADPAVRNKPATSQKNAARLALVQSLRLLAQLVQGTSTVSDAQKLTLGLTVPAQRTPQPPPADAPALDVVSVSGRNVRIRLHDANTEKRGKPLGVLGAAVFSYVGAEAPTDPANWKWEGNTTKILFDIAFPLSVAPGAQVWLTAAWFNERTQNGPLCAPASTNVQFGTGSMAA